MGKMKLFDLLSQVCGVEYFLNWCQLKIVENFVFYIKIKVNNKKKATTIGCL